MHKRKFVLMDLEPGAAGGGEPAAAAPAPAAAASVPAVPPVPAAPAVPAPSALAKPAAPVPLHERIPEKFHVKNGEELDADASWGKVLDSYKQLEERMRAGDTPPKAPEEYTIPVPEALKETWQEDERTQAFRKEAHEAGLTQKQFDLVMGRFFAVAPELLKGGIQNSVEATIASLDKAWGGDYDKNLQAAAKAFEAYADADDKGRFDEIMRDPSLAYRILAKIGPELGEARSVPQLADGATTDATIQQLLTSEALSNPKHPEHKATRAKVDAYYQAKYGTTPVN